MKTMVTAEVEVVVAKLTETCERQQREIDCLRGRLESAEMRIENTENALDKARVAFKDMMDKMAELQNAQKTDGTTDA